ncbi:carbohydrate ABC transporter permease [Floccifex sp.]|uniref:carbohydrate ABC transporter permease n=1 Tax=Floccifex sp. TaxID=2815810 RepID=UPI002A7622DA|nr:sugar ABC transporter permease [Floccifex sp.]MDD7281497.1 sugar ABC transporter permease [Erysipelotrichaceae bacterium]MDY2958949.1 sugar ABC transporter permease [Floccifex sp.]
MAQKKKKNKNNDSAAVNSKLIRKPIERCFLLFLAPTLAAFTIGFIYPFLKGFYLSFCKFQTTSNAEFIGIGNYINALHDASFVHAFWYTALYAVVSLLLINIIAFIIAYFLTQGIKGANIFRTVFFMPNLIGGIVLGYIWSMIFNGILSRYGTSILMETKFGFWGLIILMCWQQIGYMMIIYIAGLQSVPQDMMEAAKIDGASRLQTLIHITIPNVMPSITICMFLSLTNAFKLFDQNLALTGGQPFQFNPDGSVVKTTEMLALNIYNTFYGQNTMARGTAQAKAVIFFVLVAVISVAQLTATRKKEVQQ